MGDMSFIDQIFINVQILANIKNLIEEKTKIEHNIKIASIYQKEKKKLNNTYNNDDNDGDDDITIKNKLKKLKEKYPYPFPIVDIIYKEVRFKMNHDSAIVNLNTMVNMINSIIGALIKQRNDLLEKNTRLQGGILSDVSYKMFLDSFTPKKFLYITKNKQTLFNQINQNCKDKDKNNNGSKQNKNKNKNKENKNKNDEINKQETEKENENLNLLPKYCDDDTINIKKSKYHNRTVVLNTSENKTSSYFKQAEKLKRLIEKDKQEEIKLKNEKKKRLRPPSPSEDVADQPKKRMKNNKIKNKEPQEKEEKETKEIKEKAGNNKNNQYVFLSIESLIEESFYNFWFKSGLKIQNLYVMLLIEYHNIYDMTIKKQSKCCYSYIDAIRNDCTLSIQNYFYDYFQKININEKDQKNQKDILDIKNLLKEENKIKLSKIIDGHLLNISENIYRQYLRNEIIVKFAKINTNNNFTMYGINNNFNKNIDICASVIDFLIEYQRQLILNLLDRINNKCTHLLLYNNNVNNNILNYNCQYNKSSNETETIDDDCFSYANFSYRRKRRSIFTNRNHNNRISYPNLIDQYQQNYSLEISCLLSIIKL